MTIDEVTKKNGRPIAAYKAKLVKSPQDRRRERETDYEKNARELAAKKRALKPKTPI